MVADPGWRTAGAPAEIAATIAAEAFDGSGAPVERVTLPDTPAPMSRSRGAGLLSWRGRDRRGGAAGHGTKIARGAA